MNPEDYEAWYYTPRGQWIGQTEYRLLKRLLRPPAGTTLLDIGCGTGYFTRCFAREIQGCVVGVDPNPAWLAYAQAHRAAGERYVIGRAEALPFPAQRFEYTVSVTALCFVADQEAALRELLRVTRRRFVLGLLNRRSLLYRQKGRHGGTGAYRGAHWHTVAELRELFAPLPVAGLKVYTAIHFPQGTAWSRAFERLWPQRLGWGGFLAVAGEVACGE